MSSQGSDAPHPPPSGIGLRATAPVVSPAGSAASSGSDLIGPTASDLAAPSCGAHLYYLPAPQPQTAVSPGRVPPGAALRQPRGGLEGVGHPSRPGTGTGGDRSSKGVRRCPTLPRGRPRSTIGAESLSFRVRNVTGRFPLAMAAETLWMFRSCTLPLVAGGCVPDRPSGTTKWTRAPADVGVVKSSAY